MDEVLPVLLGVVLGLVTDGLVPPRLRAATLVTLGVPFGAIASWINGELMISSAYILIDVGQVLAATLAAWVLAAGWRRFSLPALLPCVDAAPGR